MDTKALAKSKRAHSLHHSKKHHPHQASRPASSTNSGPKKPTGIQSKEKPPQSEGSRLPSNWERYDEDLNLDSEEAQGTSNQLSDFVVPRSKGADYAQLISDAKDQSPANYSPEAFPLFHDDMYDIGGFTQDFGSMLAAKGQSIFSWIADDNFEFEDKGSTIPEAPFLSLDMNALAAQLSKAKLSERIFVEPDLLPRELLDDDLHACVEDKHNPQTCTSSAETVSRASSISRNQEVAEDVKQYHKPDERSKKPTKQTKYEISQSQKTNSITEKIVDSSKPSVFEAANAELELDMLLESLSGSSVGISSSGETVKRSGTHMVTDIVNDIDNLLEETSSLTRKNGNPTSKSKVVDDFASWLDTI
ncbi:hypothetical protein ABFS82_13G032500 [Erythranthe guttata]